MRSTSPLTNRLLERVTICQLFDILPSDYLFIIRLPSYRTDEFGFYLKLSSEREWKLDYNARESLSREISRRRLLCKYIFTKIIILTDNASVIGISRVCPFRIEARVSRVMDFFKNDILPFHISKTLSRNIGKFVYVYSLRYESHLNVSIHKRVYGKRKRRSRNCWKNIEPISNLWLRVTWCLACTYNVLL